MPSQFDDDARRAIRQALALRSYTAGTVRLVDADVTGWQFLVASHNGLFAVAPGKWKRLAHGWFFGICRDQDALYLFENCGRQDRNGQHGRLVRVRITEGRLVEPEVLVTGLDGNCHQVRVIDDLICVVDTANQQILRFDRDGAMIDRQTPFPPAPAEDRSGAYLHINALARIDGRLAVMLHNGKALPPKPSELAWLDDDWRVIQRIALPGYRCHDIVADPDGVVWHSASMSGEIAASDGRRAKVCDDLMTRGIAFGSDRIAVGLTVFSERQQRDGLRGRLAMLDRDLNLLETLELPGSPTDIAVLGDGNAR